MPSGAMGIWYAKDYNTTRKAIPNAATGNPLLAVITRNPRGVFETGKVGGEGGAGGWLGGGFGGTTITEKYAAGRDGVVAASRAVFASATSGIRYRDTPSLLAGTYTMVIDAKSNTGSNQDFYMSKDGESTTVTKTATTSWQQFKYEFTLGSTTAVDLRFCRPTSGNGDLVIDKAYLWDGASVTVPADLTLQGDLQFGNSSRATIATISGGEIGLTDGGVGAIDFNAFTTTSETTIIAVVKRVTNYTNSAGYRYPFIYDVVESTTPNATSSWCLGEFEAEGNLNSCFGNRLLAPAVGGFSPDLYADAQYHIMSMSADAGGLDLWMDDVGMAVNTIGTGTSMSSRKFQVGNSNSSFGLIKFKMNSLAIWNRKLTDVERRTAINLLIAKAAESSITVTKPANLLVGGIDSITVGPANNSYLQQYLANITGGKVVRVQEEAIGGSTLHLNPQPQLNFDVRLPYHLAGCPAKSSERTGRKFICTILAGANDLEPNYASDDAFLTALWLLTDQLRSRGYYVGVGTILPKGTVVSGYATHNTRRATANTKIAAAVGTHCDFVIDFAANATMGPDAAANNATYYGDGLHPTATGHGILEGIYRTAINAILV
jgi:lysophospholipase L1-like esterase